MTQHKVADLAVMKRDLLAECEDDHVGLWVVIAYVEDELPNLNEGELRELTLEVLYDMLSTGQIQAGTPDSNGRDFHPWPFSADVVVGRIAELWPPNSGRPSMGEIAYFTTPSPAPKS